MEEVIRNLFIGDRDEGVRGRPDWAIIHAEKELHRRYVDARRMVSRDAVLSPSGNELYLAFEDAMKEDQVNTGCIRPALDFAHRHLTGGRKVLIHCLAGVSRSPTIAMLYLLQYTDVLPRTNIFDAIFSFSEIYPLYNPNDGLFAYAAKFLEEIRNRLNPGEKLLSR
jgi:predicted protein tyrosine phosphatase